jgi:hypothetical protein
VALQYASPGPSTGAVNEAESSESPASRLGLVPVERALGDEVLQPSGLHNLPWPDSDPRQVVQDVRRLTPDDQSLIIRAAQAARFNPAEFSRQTRGFDEATTLYWLLSCSTFNFNGTTDVRAEPYWLDRVHAAVRAAEPVPLTYPLMCKIPNGAKQMTPVGVTAGEEAVILFFLRLDTLARQIYEPGLQFDIVSDATLYNTAFQAPAPMVARYISDLRALVARHQAACCVQIHDYVDLLQPYEREYREFYDRYFAQLWVAPESLISNDAMASLLRSVRACVNTYRLGMEYQDLRAVLGPNPDPGNPYYSAIEQQAALALREQLAIKMACDAINVFDRLWPNNIRVSCHKGRKHGRAVIGLRPYPAYYGASKFLPYHGMPVIENDRRGDPRLTVWPEIVLRARPDLVRITNTTGEPYLYVAADLGSAMSPDGQVPLEAGT